MNSPTWKCKHCETVHDLSTPQEKANHSRWCSFNPKRLDYSNNMQVARSAIKIRGNQFTKARALGLPIPSNGAKGKKRKGTPWTPEMKEHARKKALASPHRRLKKNVQEYNGMKFDSSWEIVMAKRLDLLNIRWLRPPPLVYVLKGVQHHYFPDFYLPERNVYLDPKNPHAYNVQIEKIEIVRIMYPNVQFLTSLREIENFS